MERMYVRLRVGKEAYALPIENVTEVAELGDVTIVPGAAHTVLGVLNLRGQVLPVFDLASVLQVPAGSRPPRVVVAEERGRRAGLAVDEVTDVAPLTSGEEAVELEYVRAAALEDGRLVGLLDVEGLFAALAGDRP
jgi:purine-binding chemotaxis protein CheW